MTFAKLTIAAIAGSLAIAQPTPVRANSDLGKVIVGGAILCGLTNCLQGKKRTTGTVSRGNETVRADQNALNYFGFPAGTADGVSGGKTRSAISSYQGYMGYPVTGQLNDWERGNLHSAYSRAQAGGGAVYSDVVAAEGPRGLLKAFEAEGRGQRYQPYGGNGNVYGNANYGNNNGQGAYIPQVPSVVPNNDLGGGVTASGGLPTFGLAPTQKSMAQHCGSVDILTQANGRPMDANSIVDPGQALDEQFCGARGYAMSRSQQLAAGVQGATDQQLREQCEGLVPTMAEHTAGLATQDVSQQIAAATDYATKFGAPADQLRSIGEICLGVGYQTDNPDVVLASAMLLVGAGEHAYAEVFGHHLRNGFGTATDPQAAESWYNAGLSAVDAGAAPAFLPSQNAQRMAVIRAALSGHSASIAPVTGATDANFVLPTFGTQSN
ncbi:MAG: peptidoglycan-binding protein [Rhodobacteraceae bacterium]|nr:peptidoglycan-binding protein [Paracoccaceae bacterium]